MDPKVALLSEVFSAIRVMAFIEAFPLVLEHMSFQRHILVKRFIAANDHTFERLSLHMGVFVLNQVGFDFKGMVAVGVPALVGSLR